MARRSRLASSAIAVAEMDRRPGARILVGVPAAPRATGRRATRSSRRRGATRAGNARRAGARSAASARPTLPFVRELLAGEKDDAVRAPAIFAFTGLTS
jgi:hypothetical protein